MDLRPLRGMISIVVMIIIPLAVISQLNKELLNNGLVLLSLIIIVGLINGYIFKEEIKISILYLVVIGEFLTALLFVLFYTQFSTGLNTVDPGFATLGLIFVGIMFFAVIFAISIGLAVFAIVIFIPAYVGLKIRGNK